MEDFDAEREERKINHGVEKPRRHELQELRDMEIEAVRPDAQDREEALQNFPNTHIRCAPAAIREDNRHFFEAAPCGKELIRNLRNDGDPRSFNR